MTQPSLGILLSAGGQKQLEYSFRHGLMGAYVPFSECIREALVFTDRAMQSGLSDNDHDHLMAVYAELPGFPDVLPALRSTT